MATQPKLEQSDDNQILTRLTGVETQLAAVETQLKGVETQLKGVETQLKGVETRLTVVETDLAVVKSNYATKEDIAKLQHSISSGDDKLEIKMAQMETRLIKWFVGTAVTLSAVVGTIAFSVARFIH